MNEEKQEKETEMNLMKEKKHIKIVLICKKK